MTVAAELRSGDEVLCCGHSYTYWRAEDDPPPIPPRAWPDPSFQIDGDWQGNDCVVCEKPLVNAKVTRRWGR